MIDPVAFLVVILAVILGAGAGVLIMVESVRVMLKCMFTGDCYDDKEYDEQEDDEGWLASESNA